MRGLLALGLILGAEVWCRSAAAQTPAYPQLTTSDFTVDLFQGPVVTSTRVTGLSGAYVAIAEGVDGSTQNPAAAAARTPWSRDYFDYELGVGVSFPTPLTGTDFYNRGARTELPAEQSFRGLSLAFMAQLGAWGFGAAVDLQFSDLEDNARENPLTAQFAVGHSQVGRSFLDGQLAIGVGLRTTGLAMTRGDNDLFNASGTGYEVGLLVRPNDEPLRIGAAFRSAITTDAVTADANYVNSDGQNEWISFDPDGAGGLPLERLYLPELVTLPWDLNFGFAIQLGPRPFNPRWLDPDELMRKARRHLDFRQRERERERRRLARRVAPAARKARLAELDSEQALDELYRAQTEERVDRYLKRRYERMSRKYLLVSASIVVTGPVDNGIGVEGFLRHEEQRSGEIAVISPRLGLETELVPHWLKTRGGVYLEPTRFDTSQGRLHTTLGFEQKLFPWTVFGAFEDGTSWRLSAVLDLAHRYLGWGASIGVWR